MHGIKLVHVNVGYWEPISLAPLMKLGQDRGWWTRDEDLVYYSVRENLRLARKGGLPWVARWQFMLLHRLDQPVTRALKLNPARCVELGISVDV